MKAILFDLDGTLLNTLPDLRESTNYALRKFGFSEKNEEEIRNFVGNGLKNLIFHALSEPDDPGLVDAVLHEMKAHYALHCHDATTPYPGVIELLRTLKGRGYRMAIVSNKADPMAQRLREVYFRDLISVAVGERPGIARKPAPDMVRIALHLLGEDRAIYVGDSEVDLLTAQNAGLPCLAVGWGFRSEEQLLAAGARRVYRSADALSDAILRFSEQ